MQITMNVPALESSSSVSSSVLQGGRGGRELRGGPAAGGAVGLRAPPGSPPMGVRGVLRVPAPPAAAQTAGARASGLPCGGLLMAQKCGGSCWAGPGGPAEMG